MKNVVKRTHLTEFAGVAVLAASAGGVVSCAHTNQSVSPNGMPKTIRVQLPAGAADVDVYWPDAAAQAPMVIVAHGFSRHRHNMSGRGQHLAKEGFVAVVPDLPTWSDHARNGRFISELQAYFGASESWKTRIDATRVGSAGVLGRWAIQFVGSSAESVGMFRGTCHQERQFRASATRFMRERDPCDTLAGASGRGVDSLA